MTKNLLLFLILPAFLLSCSADNESPMEGAWKLAYEIEVKGQQSTVLFPGVSQGSEIKLWSGDRWALVGVFIEDSLITDVFAGGKFTLDANDYREIVEYHSATEYLGTTVKLYLEIKNDTLTQFWPVDENGVPDKDHHYMEKWVRFE